jgi:hypothetical protein
MLIFGRGLKIAFWNIGKTAIIEGEIRYKMPTQVAENAYVVKTAFKSDDCIVPCDRITQVLLKDFDDHDVWVTIDELYKSFLNGSVICPDTFYNRFYSPKLNLPKVRLSQISTDSLKYATPCPTVNIEPIKDFGTYIDNNPMSIRSLIAQAIIFDDEFKYFLKEDKTMNFLSFETEYNNCGGTARCRLEFEMTGAEIYKFEPLLRRAKDSLQIKNFSESVLMAFLDATNLPKPKKVIFNGPATIVMWEDNTKTVVKKAEGEPDDKEKAIMYCVFKKIIGDKPGMDKYINNFLKEEKKVEKKEEKASSGKLHRKKPGTRKSCSKS